VKTIVRIKVSLLISKIPLAMDGATALGREKGVVQEFADAACNRKTRREKRKALGLPMEDRGLAG
jgi:hypothetical protein